MNPPDALSSPSCGARRSPRSRPQRFDLGSSSPPHRSPRTVPASVRCCGRRGSDVVAGHASDCTRRSVRRTEESSDCHASADVQAGNSGNSLRDVAHGRPMCKHEGQLVLRRLPRCAQDLCRGCRRLIAELRQPLAMRVEILNAATSCHQTLPSSRKRTRCAMPVASESPSARPTRTVRRGRTT